MRKFCLLGETLKHSMSPQIHRELFKLSNKSGEYSLLEVPHNEFSKNAEKLIEFEGYNITIPYKVDIIPYLDHIDTSAERYGAVNCVDNKNGVSTGYNTDVDGFLKSLEVNDIKLSGNVLLLGLGGVGRMMACEACLAGGKLTVAVRKGSESKSETIKKEILKHCPDAEINIVNYDEISGHFDTLINSTPVGMYPDNEGCPVDDKVISNCDAVFDAIYNPVETVLVRKAKQCGKIAVGGMEMLVWQAVVAHEIWDNAEYLKKDISIIITKMEDEVRRKFK